jgi:hypothetical protein
MDSAKNNILLIAFITSLLIMGTFVISMESYADDSSQQKHKAVSDLKNDILKDMQSENASQHLIEDDS